ncbi:MAG: PIN-like domain-containing protein [Planctomycetota bacterium]
MGEAGDRSVAKDVIILMDEDSCGRRAVEALVELGEHVRTVRSVFGQSVKDAEWLPVAGASGWAVVTRDKTGKRGRRPPP